MHPLLKHYSSLIQFLGRAMGNNCELVLHDTNNHSESIIEIVNGHVTGRKVGAPITQLALEWITSGLYKEKKFVGPYASKTDAGNTLSSSGWFIKDYDNTLVGMLCVNIDISHFTQASKAINQLLEDTNLSLQEIDSSYGKPSPEEFPSTINDFTSVVIKRAIDNAPVPPERMNADEKIEILRKLNKDGVFQLKGSISIIAEHLATSEPTIYRYLKKLSIK